MDNYIIRESQYDYKNCIKPLMLPTHLHKPEYRYKQTCGNNHNRPIIIKYEENDTFIDDADIRKLHNNILMTRSRFVYPLEFVNIAKKYVLHSNNKLMFSENHLRKLQIWSNQLREMSSSENRNIEAENYITYMICIKAIKYAKKDNCSTV